MILRSFALYGPNVVTLQDLPLFWTTAEGKRIPVPDLTDDHLENIIRHLREHGVNRQNGIYQYMVAEANKRGLKEVTRVIITQPQYMNMRQAWT